MIDDNIQTPNHPRSTQPPKSNHLVGKMSNISLINYNHKILFIIIVIN